MLLNDAWHQRIAALETMRVYLDDINLKLTANNYRSDTYIERIHCVVINQFESFLYTLLNNRLASARLYVIRYSEPII